METKTIKLWIDDLRDAPDDTWMTARSSEEAIDILCEYDPEIISFDHDLGGQDTAMKVVDMIEKWVFLGHMDKKFEWKIHSMNPVGRANLRRALESIDRQFKELAMSHEDTR